MSEIERDHPLSIQPVDGLVLASCAKLGRLRIVGFWLAPPEPRKGGVTRAGTREAVLRPQSRAAAGDRFNDYEGHLVREVAAFVRRDLRELPQRSRRDH
jgi:hypothetical protein